MDAASSGRRARSRDRRWRPLAPAWLSLRREGRGELKPKVSATAG